MVDVELWKSFEANGGGSAASTCEADITGIFHVKGPRLAHSLLPKKAWTLKTGWCVIFLPPNCLQCDGIQINMRKQCDSGLYFMYMRL